MTDRSPEPGPSDDPLDRHRARRHPEDAVDELERRVLGGPDHRLDGGHPDALAPTEAASGRGADTEPAFAVDVDPEDQGSSDVAPRNPD
ncbi:hypothetical protein Acsp06_51190 [Actinomycetospora sp. NBRC 106375]|uniref:hypothetical protein n=1 Tax=Actinomycetospora sp. NBRC 106375 TaxID=3032207 RepID=UPI0024A116CE|nr:hypothetical protein [Actinomycetospora sp. NBRC 106375]GLZ48934.1 hypothetical protein Acsp06_51190 [Actinomycetospora sp. NBRC 106375]